MCILQGKNTFERGNTLASIRKRGNSYLFRVYAGYDTDGKQIEKTKTWKPPADWTERRAEKEAHRLAALFEEQVRTGGLSNGKMKFADFAAYWMQKYAEPNLKPKTVTRYNGLLRRINRSIGYLPLNKIQPGNLLEFYQSHGDETPENVAYRCVVDLKKLLKEKGLTQVTCADNAGIYLPSRGIFTETPKTKSSKRLVIISDQVLDILRGQLLWQHLQAKRLPDRWMDSGRVITSEDGSPMHPDRLTRWFGKFIRRTDLPQIHVHSLRHTYATLCIANGVPITAVAAQLGHANVAITATIYAHAIRTAQIAAADKVGGLFANVIKCD